MKHWKRISNARTGSFLEYKIPSSFVKLEPNDPLGWIWKFKSCYCWNIYHWLYTSLCFCCNFIQDGKPMMPQVFFARGCKFGCLFFVNSFLALEILCFLFFLQEFRLGTKACLIIQGSQLLVKGLRPSYSWILLVLTW